MYLVEETGATTGYTQSDEISLCWKQESYKRDIFFAGKIQKMVPTLSALATAKFVELALRRFPLGAPLDYLHSTLESFRYQQTKSLLTASYGEYRTL